MEMKMQMEKTEEMDKVVQGELELELVVLEGQKYLSCLYL